MAKGNLAGVTLISQVMVARWIALTFAFSSAVLPFNRDGKPGAPGNGDGGPSPSGDGLAFIEPAPGVAAQESAPGGAVEWDPLSRQSTYFLGIMHGFRLLTEQGTRSGLRGPFWKNYANSVTNLHGIADGDPFYVNYLGHPLQGSVVSQMFRHNDPRYRDVEFGRSRRYWKSTLRGMGYAWAFSTQFEIGPLSEASIGAIQSRYPQQGFVDHIVTPTIGAAWAIGEDAIDRYLIKRMERATENPWIRAIARSVLNPSRSMANTLRGKEFWYRDSRPGVYAYRPHLERRAPPPDDPSPPAVEGVAPFELHLPAQFTRFGDHTCLGGGADAAFRVTERWQAVLQVSGCKSYGLGTNWSGDALTYLLGPRWQAAANSRWSPYVHVLVGGQKVTQEWTNAELRQKLVRSTDTPELSFEKRALYTRSYETNGLALNMGGGVQVGLNSALALRLASLEYVQAWSNPVNGFDYGNGVRFSVGLTLRVGTW